MFIPNKRGQALIEYAVLLAVIAAVILISQYVIRRGAQGNLKDAADKISGGESFSASETSIRKENKLADAQLINEETATGVTMDQFVSPGTTLKHTLDKQAFSYSERTGGQQTAETKSKTGSFSVERTRIGDYQNDTVEDYTIE
jgi:Flp pilus assembly pilin Flp